MHCLVVLPWLIAVLVMTSVGRADDVPADVTSFEQLVLEGDHARIAAKYSDAVRAYSRALELRDDPRIHGKLGLVALDAGATAEAMSHLLRAIVDGNSIPPGELQRIESAFNQARQRVSRIKIKISHVGADVTIDGLPESLGTSANDFYVFKMPGAHEIRATLEGYSDAVANIETKKGETVEVSLVLTQLPIAPPPEPEPAPAPECKPCEQKEDWASVEEPKKPTAKEIEAAEDKRVLGQWIPGFGVTALYGAVSPYPAAGAVLSSYWKLSTVFSTGFDVRAAMSQRSDDDASIRGATLALLPGFCVMRAPFTGCFTVHGGFMWHSSYKLNMSMVRHSIGAGANLGFTFARYAPIDFRIAFYGELLFDPYPISRGNFDRALWTGPQFMAGLSLTAVLNR